MGKQDEKQSGASLNVGTNEQKRKIKTDSRIHRVKSVNSVVGCKAFSLVCVFKKATLGYILQIIVVIFVQMLKFLPPRYFLVKIITKTKIAIQVATQEMG